jgi:hypothetical protein
MAEATENSRPIINDNKRVNKRKTTWTIIMGIPGRFIARMMKGNPSENNARQS